jgi:DNA (cytosine-5)-methyltransferase 1
LERFIELCEQSGKPYVVENVMAARFPADYPSNLVLCADRHFGLRTVRHRQFRCSGFTVPQLPHTVGHSAPTSTKKRQHDWDRGMHVSVTGDVGRQAMGIDWMNGNELSQAIPPVYTEYIGRHLLTALDKGVQ